MFRSRTPLARVLMCVVFYVALMAASAWVRSGSDSETAPPQSPAGARSVVVDVARVDRGTRLVGASMQVHALLWEPPPSERDRGLPVVLLHGSPGSGSNFVSLGPMLTNTPIASPLDQGENETSRGDTRAISRDVYAFDLPGFGYSSAWIPDYSVQSAAVALHDTLDAMGIERAHMVGWSNGGGVGLELAALDPDRVASLTLLASIGLQETEGSGSYWFEHAKYALGYATLVLGAELVPHFGALGPVSGRHTFLRSFFDTDQRRLGPIMREIDVPVLVVHGRRDFLTAAWSARAHQAAIPGSALVMLESDHFLPMTQPGMARDWLGAFFAYHDRITPLGAKPYVGVIDQSVRTTFAHRSEALGRAVRGVPWWLSGLLLLGWGRIAPRWTLAFAAVLVGIVQFDIGLAWAALGAGRLWRESRRTGPWMSGRSKLFGLGWLRAGLIAAMQVGLVLGAVFIGMQTVGVPWLEAAGPRSWFGASLRLVAVVLLVRVAISVFSAAPTARGRRGYITSLRRALNHEFWPMWAIYAPVAVWVVWLMIRHHSVRVATCCNPAMTRLGSVGGGLALDPKSAVLDVLGDHPAVLASRAVDPEPSHTLEDRVRAAINELGGFPVALKPETGERGRGVCIVRTDDEMRRAVDKIVERTVVQRYHAGPLECGVFWVRTPEGGRIFSITRKRLPEVTGDGVRSVAQLVRRSRDLRDREAVLEHESASQWSRVPARGEHVVLCEAANHARGALFRDGADLSTPDLERLIRELADRFNDLGGFDFGRFDIRYPSDAGLRRAEGMAIIEVNGLASESVNVYDPSFGAIRAWRTLCAQWSEAFRVGRINARRGVPPARWASLLRAAAQMLC